MTVEILPPGRAAIGTATDVVRALARLFPKHGPELAEWAPSYQRALGHLSPERMAAVFAAVVDGWSRNSPPRPADFAAHAPSAGIVERLGGATAGNLPLFYRHPEDKRLRCTQMGFIEAKKIKTRLIDDALRMVDETLTGDEAWRLARSLDERAWIAAQRLVMDLAIEPIEITPADVARIRHGIWADANDPRLLKFRDAGMGAIVDRAKPVPPASPELRALADQPRERIGAPVFHAEQSAAEPAEEALI